MNYPSGVRKSSRMVADRETPWISVSLLAEHIYCPRAGIIQCETQQEDTGEELFHLGRGKRRTFYDFPQLQRALKRTFLYTCFTLLLSILLALITFTLGNESAELAAAGTFGLFCTSLACVIGIFRWLFIYFALYLPAKLARASVPDPRHTEPQMIHWWNLINAGFRPIRPQEQYRDVQWHLAGCPWRILVKGDVRIPVFRKRLNRGTAGEKLFRQHYARMAAYCHLIEKCEKAWSPYGIILLGDTHHGITVPCQPGTKKAFHDGLVQTRTTLANQYHVLPSYPSHLQLCVLCPHSRRDRVTGMSVCGTRFGWIPPNYKDTYR